MVEFKIEQGILKRVSGDEENIVIPQGVTRIDAGAFSSCKNRITSVEIPESVKDLNGPVFEGCPKLKKVILHEGLERLGYGCFRGCIQLEDIDIPDSVLSIGAQAFEGCSALKKIKLPSGVKEIFDGTFDSCSSLESVIMSDGVFRLGEKAFRKCIALAEIVLSASLLEIADYCFERCLSLRKMIINQGIIRIGKGAFYDCLALNSLSMPRGKIRIGQEAFRCCPCLADEKGFVIVRGVLFDYVGRDRKVTIPDTVKIISNGAFSLCADVTDVNIPASVWKIGNEVFAFCDNLSSVVMADGVTKIGSEVFRYSPDLKKVRFSSAVEEFGTDVFDGCKCLEEIYAPSLPLRRFSDELLPAARGFFTMLQSGEITDKALIEENLEYVKNNSYMLKKLAAEIPSATDFFCKEKLLSENDVSVLFGMSMTSVECRAMLLEYSFGMQKKRKRIYGVVSDNSKKLVDRKKQLKRVSAKHLKQNNHKTV